ncbi:hypothetical protein [Acanthopleuribacter pedis]
MRSIELQMKDRDAAFTTAHPDLEEVSQQELNQIEHDAHLEMTEELAVAIVLDMRRAIQEEEGWSLVLAGARLLREDLERRASFLRQLQRNHAEILNELAGDRVRLSFHDAPFKQAIATELELLCSLFKRH